jgi:glycopeptide antibiotics resistance protein
MLSFFENFSDSFLLAMMMWPFAALLLTFPILLVQYVRFHYLPKRRVMIIYFFILYVLALVAFTLYPMPDNPQEFCNDYALSPQLNPLQFIFDIQGEGWRAGLQILMNTVFFVPLGVALHNLFGKKIFGTVMIALAVSLCIEIAQLTGFFHIYPCSYRLFDVDDLMFNSLGALAGYALGFLLPDFSKIKKITRPTTRPRALHRFVTFFCDYVVGAMLSIVVVLPIYFADGEWRTWLLLFNIGWFVVLQVIIPMVWRGQTLFGKLTGVSLDDKNRSSVWRVIFYLARVVLLGFIVFSQTYWSLILLVVVVVYYFVFRRMPYALVDLFFERKSRRRKTGG